MSRSFILRLCLVYLFKSTRVAAVYASVCLLALLGFVIVTFIRPAVVRVPLMLVMLIGWTFELSILDLTGTMSNQNLFWLMWLERAIGSEAVRGYAPYIIRDLLFVASLGVVLCASPARRFSVSGMFGLLPIVAGPMVAGVILYTKGGTQTFPIPFGTFSNAAIALVSASNNPRATPWGRDPTFLSGVVKNGEAKFEGPVHPIFNKIVVIMDESVRGDYISLNDATNNGTPFLKTVNHLVNFGVAISGGNCSFLSRTIFRFGMRQSELPNDWREALAKPTIWQFAHKAGYKTVHIDAELDAGPVVSELTLAERALVDSRIPILENPGYLRDLKVADGLREALRDEGPAFIYVTKFGVHFPYSDKHPRGFHMLPTVAESDISKHQNANVWSLDVKAFLRSFLPPYDHEIVEYPTTVAWSVDEFFRNLLPGLDLSKTLMVYTSDHGQSLLPGHATHCSGIPVPPGEAYVPLFALTSMPEFEQRLEAGAARGFDRFSHFEVFPTLLLAMGYDAGWVGRAYGPSLLDLPSPDRKFMIGSPDFQPMMIQADGFSRPASSSIEPRQHQMSKVNWLGFALGSSLGVRRGEPSEKTWAKNNSAHLP